MIEKSYFIKNLRDLSILPEEANRIYFGSEYCIRAMNKNYLDILKKAEKKYKISLLLPPILESEIYDVLEVIEQTKKNLENSYEIVINDWGLLHFLSKNRDEKASLVIGRILSYQKRGNQNLYNVITSDDLGNVPILQDKMINFLKSLGVERIEIDVPFYGVKINKKPEIKLSVYSPFSVLSYTLNCPFTFEKGAWNRKCKRQCINNFLVYTGGDAITDFHECGKIYYTKSEKVIDIADRIVYIAWEKKDT